MRKVFQFFVVATVLALAAAASTSSLATDAQPEVQRAPGSSTAQPVGQLHTLRNIPEACVRLEGQFSGDAAAPYRLQAVKRDPCVQRAVYVDASRSKLPPTIASGWILNDRIAVPRADAPACVAVVEIWRRPGDIALPKLDAQGRSRLYLDKSQRAVAAPLFTATLAIDAKSCN